MIDLSGRCKGQRFECILRPCKREEARDESSPFGNDLELKDFRQTKRTKLENILRNYERENFKDLLDEE
ncbi:hypothetical protein ACROYT_G023835 [Oculina patagonica]